MKRRRGFTLIEIIGATVMMALIVIGVVAVSLSIDDMRVGTRNTVYMSTHNLNCIERIQQMCLDPTQDMLLYYGDDVFGSDTIETEVFLELATWDKFSIYRVTIESCMREGGQRLTNVYLITDISGVSFDESVNEYT